jgi:hypothetical protein
MDRRTALQTIGGGLTLSLAGCQQYEAVAPSETTREATAERGSEHSLTVTKRVEHGQTGLERTLKIEDGGQVAYELRCPDETTKTARAELSSDEWLDFKQLVVESDVAGLDSEYECAGDCPRDVPPTSLTFEIDGETTEIVVEAGADVPTRLADITTEIGSFEDALKLPTCS